MFLYRGVHRWYLSCEHFVIWTYVNSGFHSFKYECKEGQKNRIVKKGIDFKIRQSSFKFQLKVMNVVKFLNFSEPWFFIYEILVILQRSIYHVNLELSSLTSLFICHHPIKWKHNLLYCSDQNHRIILDSSFFLSTQETPSTKYNLNAFTFLCLHLDVLSKLPSSVPTLLTSAPSILSSRSSGRNLF